MLILSLLKYTIYAKVKILVVLRANTGTSVK